MKRLTNANHKELGFYTYDGDQNPFKLPLTVGELGGCLNVDYSPRKILEDIFGRLAAYEDTGLMPEDVTNLMAAHGEAIYGLAEYRALGPAKKLKELLAPPPNDPLTLEELREMDGEPVYVDFCFSGCWAIIHKGWARFGDGDSTPIEKIDGLAYRRKPEEETT